MTDSILYKVGHFIEPVTKIFGMGWQTFMAFVASSLGKEGALGVLSTIYTGSGTISVRSVVGGAAAENINELLVTNVSRPEALALIFAMTFNMPCIVALAATYQETHSVKWTVVSRSCPKRSEAGCLFICPAWSNPGTAPAKGMPGFPIRSSSAREQPASKRSIPSVQKLPASIITIQISGYSKYAIHIRNIIRLSEMYPGYRFYTLPDTPFPNMKLMIADDMACIIHAKRPDLSFGVTHSLLCRAFRSYAEALMEQHRMDRNTLRKMLEEKSI